MKHIPTFEQFVNESYNRTQTKYKTQNVDWDDVAPGDYIADGPNVGEVSRVISNTKKGFTLKRVWNNVRKKDGEEFFVPHDLDAMKDHPKSIIKVIDYVNESAVNETLAAASADKLTNHEPLTPKVNATLISNARNGVLKMMKEPDGKTHFWNPKTKEYVAKTITYNGKGEFLYSDAIDKDGNLKESLDLNEGRKYTAKEKNKFFDYWDVLFTELGITDVKEQDAVVKAFDKLDGDDANGTLVEVISDALDKAKVGFNYKKLEEFYQKHIK
jgi:hypothetical protein